MKHMLSLCMVGKLLQPKAYQCHTQWRKMSSTVCGLGFSFPLFFTNIVFEVIGLLLCVKVDVYLYKLIMIFML